MRAIGSSIRQGPAETRSIGFTDLAFDKNSTQIIALTRGPKHFRGLCLVLAAGHGRPRATATGHPPVRDRWGRLSCCRFRGHRDKVFLEPAAAHVAIQVHGWFWHRHASCANASPPSTRPDFRASKFAQNVRRDERKREEVLKWAGGSRRCGNAGCGHPISFPQ